MFTAFAVGLGLTASVMAQVPSYVPSSGLVGWWPFNGNANDESGNGNNGTVNGATLTADRFGNASQAYNFDGVDDFIELGSISGLNSTQGITLSIWLKYFGSNGTTNEQFAFLVGGSPNAAIIINENLGETQGTVTNCNCPDDIYVTNPINLSEWTNVILTYYINIGLSKLYINGILADSSIENMYSYYTTNNSNERFGNYHFNSHFFKGQLDEAGLWNRALTYQEISNLYNPNSCSNDLTISSISNIQNIGGNTIITATTTDSNPTFTWQSDFGQGFQTLNNYGNYSGTTSNSLTISNVQLANHNQQIRAISTSGNCIDTSDVAVLTISNICTSNVTIYDTVTTNETIYDTTNVTIYDTLTTNVYDTLTTNITVYDTITTNITIYDTLTTNVYDTTYITVSDTLLTTVTDTLIINTTLSLPAPNNENTILIYPNPASDHITINNGNFSAMAGYSIKITNNAGKQVFQSAINQQQFYVDLSTWTGNGLYFVHLIDPQNNTVTVRKIVLQ